MINQHDRTGERAIQRLVVRVGLFERGAEDGKQAERDPHDSGNECDEGNADDDFADPEKSESDTAHEPSFSRCITKRRTPVPSPFMT